MDDIFSSPTISRREMLRTSMRASAVLLLGSSMLQACSSDGETSTPTPTEAPPTTTLSVADAGGGFGLLVVDLSAQLEARRVEVEVNSMSPADSGVAVLNELVDMTNGTIATVVNAHLQGNDNATLIAPTFGGHISVMVKPDGPTSLEELKGARIGTFPRATNSYSDLFLIAAEMGMHLEEDFELTFGDGALLEGLFAQNELDAFTTFDPNVTRLILSGEAIELLQYNQAWLDLTGYRLPPACLLVRKEWVTDSGLAEAVVEASQANVESLVRDADRYFDNRELFNLPDDDALLLLQERMEPLFASKWTDELYESFEFYMSRAVEKEMLEPGVSTSDIITRDI